MAVASADYLMGSQQQIMQLPDWLRGRTELFADTPFVLGMGHYRLFIIAVCAALTVGLQYVLSATRFGSRLRASVDDARVASGLGINVNAVFAVTFAVGSGLAGLGGALGAEVLASYGITLRRVPLAATSDAVTSVTTAARAGIAGDIDLIWINGKNFKARAARSAPRRSSLQPRRLR
jgi:ABC-type uncharacterized transport system permease subunit